MDHQLRATGILLGIIFAAATVLNVVTGLASSSSLESKLINWDFLVLFFATALMFASAFISRLAWIQPMICFAFTPIPLLEAQGYTSFYGLGFYVIGLLLLFRLGFFERQRLPKLGLALAYLYGWEIYAALRTERNLIYAFTPTFFITVFLLLLYFAYHEKIMVYLKEPKERISMAEKGLSEAERNYVTALLHGVNSKEISYDYEVSESTVRNTLSRAYRKLGVEDKAGLAALAERCELVD